MGYDEIIDPRELRNALIEGLDLLEGRRVNVAAHVPGE
jgi:hypothetical protein